MGSVTLTMLRLLTVVVILTCHLSLGEDGMSGDTLDSLEQVGLPDDKFLEPRYECPQSNMFFDGNNIAVIPGIQNWHECGIICIHTTPCNFWSWNTNNNDCYLKTSD